MWTVTLPPTGFDQLLASDGGWPAFQDTIRRRFSELLARRTKAECSRHPSGWRTVEGGYAIAHGPEALWLFAVEPHKSGLPHLHFLFRSRIRANRAWLIKRSELDALIMAALRAVTGREVDVSRAGRVEAVNHRAGVYIAKYLSKGKGSGARHYMEKAGTPSSLIPVRYWGMSRPFKETIEANTSTIPSSFVSVLSACWEGMEEAGWLHGRIWYPDSPGAPGILCLRFKGPDGFKDAMEACWALSLDWSAQ